MKIKMMKQMDFFKKSRIVFILLLVLFTATTSTLLVEDVYADESYEVLRLVNEERVVNSLEPLQMDKELNDAAEIRCEEIETKFSHTRPDGTRGLEISQKAMGENLAAGYETSQEVVSAWMNSPSHKKNLLNPNFTIIGISHKKTSFDYKNYWVQLFGGVIRKKITLEKIKAIKTEIKKNKIILNWKKQSSSIATGYEVFTYIPKTKKYKLLIKIKKHDISSLIIFGLHSSKTYKYQIRSYKVINKKTYYGPSSTITARTK